MSTRQTAAGASGRKSSASASAQSVKRVTPWLTAALLVLALGLLVSGGRMALAGLASYQAQAFLDAWEQPAVEPSARAWQVAHAAAQRAISLYPTANADYLDRLGRVYSWQYFRHPYSDPVAASSQRLALAQYRAASVARPTWPYTWARLAHTKANLQEFDAEFAQAFTQAFALGPWRIAVNRELAEIGFNAWPQLNPSQQQATLESARRSVADGPSEAKHMLAVATQNGRLTVLCDNLTTELKTARQVCR